MRERSLKTKRGTVYYWISKDWMSGRDTIFFFPGLTADHTLYEKQIEYFKGKYNLIVWDAPAHGKSRPYTDFSCADASQDILQIMEQENIDDFIAVGHSFGGYFVQAFLYRYPKKVKVFIAIGSTPYGDGYYSKMDKFWLRQVEWLTMLYPDKILKKAASKQVSVTEEGYQNMMSMLEPYSKREYAHLMAVSYRAFLEDNKEIKITCPVFIMQGDSDRAGKVVQYCRMWAMRTGYPIKIIEHAGHDAMVDNPTEVNQQIENFLNCTLGLFEG